MIARNAAVRQGRRILATSASQTTLRHVSTEAALKESHTSRVEQAFTAPQAAAAAPKLVSSSKKKKQKAIRDAIPMLGADSAHEHRGLAWTRPAVNELTGEQQTPSQQFADFNRIQKNTRNLGSRVERRYAPTELIANPPGPQDVTLELLMASQTHMGHNKSLWNPANSRYIYGVRQGIHIISLETTAAHLRRAARVVEEVAYRGGLILMVGNRKGQMEIVTKAAEMAGACHLFTKWTPGAITNRDVILRQQSVKVVDQMDKNLEDFETYKNNMRPLMPDLVICLNPLENYTLLYECGLQDIPTIGVIDTNADPTWVTYTIPANDDSFRSIGVIAGVLGRAGQAGQKRRTEEASRGQASWPTRTEIRHYMDKEVNAALLKRKEVMGKMQSNVQDFTEEEQQLLQSANAHSAADLGTQDMVDMLREALADDAAVPEVEGESGASMEARLDAIETQLEAAQQEALEIETAVTETKKQE